MIAQDGDGKTIPPLLGVIDQSLFYRLPLLVSPLCLTNSIWFLLYGRRTEERRTDEEEIDVVTRSYTSRRPLD